MTAPRVPRRVSAKPDGPPRGRFSREDEEAGGRESFEDAALYDWEYRRRRADVNFYRGLAAERLGYAPAPALDLACGTGRLLLPLLRDGHHLLGLDRSRPMLDRAAARVRKLSPARRGRALLLQADLGHFGLARRFGFAVCAFHSVQHLIEQTDLRRFFASVHGALLPDGWFAFDVLPPDPAWLDRSAERRWARTRFRHPRTGERLIYTTNHVYDRVRRTLHMRIYYQPVDDQDRATGPERVVRLAHRQLSPAEIHDELARAGFDLLASYGGFDGRALDDQADEHIYLARPAQPGVKWGVHRREKPTVPVGGGSGNSLDTPGGDYDARHRRCSSTEGGAMAEKVAKLGISRDKDHMLYVKDGAVWRVRRKQPGMPKGRPEKVKDGGFEMDFDYIYFVDKDGDVSRAKRAVGGQKRKATPKKAARKPAKKKAPAKKPAKSATRKAAPKAGRSSGRTSASKSAGRSSKKPAKTTARKKSAPAKKKRR